MSHTVPTTESSAVQAELQQFFERFASNAFDSCCEAHRKADFYRKLLADLQQGRVLSEELPEAEGLPISIQRAAIQKLLKQAIMASESTWELIPEVDKEFRTTIRMHLAADETVPQYDIEYQAKDTKDPVKVAIKTWRRNITVELIGTPTSLAIMHSRITLAGLRSGKKS